MAREKPFRARSAPGQLSLPTTKSGQRLQDTPEAVVISGVTVIARICAMLSRSRPGEKLWPQSVTSCWLFGQQAMCRLSPSCPQLTTTLSSTGRVSSHFLEYDLVDKAAIRELFSSPNTARMYTNEAAPTFSHITVTGADVTPNQGSQADQDQKSTQGYQMNQ